MPQLQLPTWDPDLPRGRERGNPTAAIRRQLGRGLALLFPASSLSYSELSRETWVCRWVWYIYEDCFVVVLGQQSLKSRQCFALLFPMLVNPSFQVSSFPRFSHFTPSCCLLPSSSSSLSSDFPIISSSLPRVWRQSCLSILLFKCTIVKNYCLKYLWSNRINYKINIWSIIFFNRTKIIRQVYYTSYIIGSSYNFN